MIRILNAEPDNYSPEARQILASIGEIVEKHLSQSELLQWVADFDVLIVRLGLEVNSEVVKAGHRLRVILTATTGLDHINVEAAEARGIAVLSLKGEAEFLRSIPATAEHTWGLLLALVRYIPWAFESVRKGEWNRDAFRGHELASKRLGIIGLGRIGEQVARYGNTFGMQVFGYDPYRTCWPDTVNRCISLHDLLRYSDVLSLHVPLNKETQSMIGKIELSLLPRGAILINTSRGAVLNEKALVEALEKGHLGGAAVDVIEAEHDVIRRQRSPLLEYAKQHCNLIITPHLGGVTVESMTKAEVFMAKKLAAFLQAAP